MEKQISALCANLVIKQERNFKNLILRPVQFTAHQQED